MRRPPEWSEAIEGVEIKKGLAESEGFEPPIPVKVWLISSQLHSTGLCQLSAFDHLPGSQT